MRELGKLVCVGYTTIERQDWQQFVAPIKAPSNYKDEAKKAAYVKEATEAQLSKAMSGFLTCEFNQFVAVEVQNGNPANTTHELMRGQRLAFLNRFDMCAVINPTLMRHLLIREEIEYKGELDPDDAWLFFSQRTGHQFLSNPDNSMLVFDPVHAITCTGLFDEELDLVKRAYLGDIYQTGLYSGDIYQTGLGDYVGYKNAHALVQLCYALCEKMGLIHD
jgi:hypothetical protein